MNMLHSRRLSTGLAILLAGAVGGGMAGAQGLLKKKKKKGDPKEEVKQPEDVGSLHDAMEGVGAQAERMSAGFKAKKSKKIASAAEKMLQYIEKASAYTPELAKTEEDANLPGDDPVSRGIVEQEARGHHQRERARTAQDALADIDLEGARSRCGLGLRNRGRLLARLL